VRVSAQAVGEIDQAAGAPIIAQVRVAEVLLPEGKQGDIRADHATRVAGRMLLRGYSFIGYKQPRRSGES